MTDNNDGRNIKATATENERVSLAIPGVNNGISLSTDEAIDAARDLFAAVDEARDDTEDDAVVFCATEPLANGVYLIADTPRTAHPLAVEGVDGTEGDVDLLREVLAEDTDVVTVEAMQEEANRYAHDAGFWDVRPDDRPDLYVPQTLALIHSEVTEALEAHREGDDEEFAEELADVIIRVGDIAGEEGVDLESQIARKQAKNRERETRHGKKY